MGNLSPGRRSTGVRSRTGYGTGDSVEAAYLMLPAHTDVRDQRNGAQPDALEVPGGSGRFYLANHVEDVAKGFTNEYRMVVLRVRPPWPTPYP